MSELLPADITNQIIASQLHEGTVTFANGQHANNHLDLGYDETSPLLRPYIVDAFSRLLFVKNIDIDFIVPVPSGAEGWIDAYSNRQVTSPEIIRLRKLQKRQFELFSDLNANDYRGKQGIVVDDVTSDGGTSEAAADHMTDKGFNILAVVSLFVRGRQLLPSKYQRLWLAHRPIPQKLDWQKFRQQGKIEQL